MPDWAWQFYPAGHLIGRILFTMVFIGSGLNHLMKHAEMTAYAESKGVPAPKVVVAVTGIVILVGGFMVLLGWSRFIGASLLVLFLVPTAFKMHAFWKEQDPMARGNEMAHFLKDLALAGGALLIAYYSYQSWPLSVGG